MIRRCRPFVFLVPLLLFGISTVAVANEPDWGLENANFQASLFHVEFLNSRFLAVGNRGIVLESSNGIHWTHRDIPECSRVEGIAYGNTTYVAVGDGCGSYIWRSSDLESWTGELVSGLNQMHDVEWNGQEFVAVGKAGEIWSSSDGQSWSQEISPATSDLRSVVWSGTFLVAVGDDSTIVYRTVTSGWSDSVSGVSGAGDIRRVAWGGGKFVAVAEDGIMRATVPGSWTLAPTPNGMVVLAGITWTGTYYVATGFYGKIAKSTDAATWNIVPQTIYQHLRGAAWSGDTLVVVGWDGTIMTAMDSVLENWTVRSTTVAEITGIAFDGSKTCAIERIDWSFHHIISSSGGLSWSRQLGSPNSFDVNGLEWIGDRLIGAAANDIYWSFDCESWNTAYIPGGPWLEAVTGVDDQLVAVGLEIYYNSGSSWFEANYPVYETLLDAATNGTVWVAVGDSVVVASYDRVSWVEVTPQVTLSLESVASNGQSFVAVGGSDILFSPDGIQWSVIDPAGSPSYLSKVRYLVDRYVAFGKHSRWVSTDGQIWIDESYGFPENWRIWINDAVDSNGLLRAGGAGGNFLMAGPLFIDGFENGDTSAWSGDTRRGQSVFCGQQAPRTISSDPESGAESDAASVLHNGR